jgi:RHS repeat-associated protein
VRKYTTPQSMKVEDMLGDHLGSTNLTTDTNGAKVSEIRYKPWGEIRYAWTSHPSTTPAYTLPSYTFTGQYSYLDDPSTSGVTEGFGLMFYNARWYDPLLGRFAQADTLVPDPANPQSLNRYAYTLNNPLRYTDPTGHFAWFVAVPVGALIGAGVTYGFQVAANISQNGLNVQAFTQVNWAAVGGGAVAGAVGVATFGVGTAVLGTGLAGTVAAGAISGAVAGQAAQATENVLSGQAVTEGLGEPGDIVRDAVIGGVSAGVFKGVQSWRAARTALHYTQEGDEFIHYGFARHAESFKGGIRPGGFATPSEGTIMTASTAQQRLALPRSALPDAYYIVRPAPGTPTQGPRRVLPLFKLEGWRPIFRIGLGEEVVFPEGTHPGSVSGPYWLPQ